MSPKICVHSTDLPESCAKFNHSAGVVIMWHDLNAGRSFNFIADSLIKFRLQLDPSLIMVQDTTVDQYRTILRRSDACDPPCMLIDRFGPGQKSLIHVFATYPLIDISSGSCYQPMLEMLKSLCDSPFKKLKKPPLPQLEIKGNWIRLRR
jgi:hypothetical protein